MEGLDKLVKDMHGHIHEYLGDECNCDQALALKAENQKLREFIVEAVDGLIDSDKSILASEGQDLLDE